VAKSRDNRTREEKKKKKAKKVKLPPQPGGGFGMTPVSYTHLTLPTKA